MSTTLPLFWHLSSASKTERIEASVKLISTLEHFQNQFKAPSPSEEDEESADALELLNAQDVSYSVRRLIRGLASPRESSRLGFSVALTELLSRLDTVTCSQVYSLIMDATKPQGSMTGQEERDIFFARLFGMTAIIQSKLLVRTKPLPTSQSSETLASSLSGFQEVISQLLALGEKKSWLRESAWWGISSAVDVLKDADVTWKDEALNFTVQHLFVENKVWSPEKVALALKLQSSFTGPDWRTLVAPTFKSSDLLSNPNLQTLASILKESDIDSEVQDIPKNAASSWKPQLHFVWNIILDRFSGPITGSSNSFPEFFRIVVDESLFSSTSSPERKYWGFQVFQRALPRVSEDNIPMLFTKNFMRTLINHLSKRDRYLHKIAKQTVTEIQAFVQSNPKIGFALILQLTGVHGSQQFDKLTKTKTVESILSSMYTDDIKQYIAYLLRQTNDTDVDVQAINGRRRWIIDQLTALIRNGAISKSDDWIQSVLDWLVVNGFFVVNKKSEKSSFIGLWAVPKPQFSDELRQLCRDKLLSCLADLTNQATAIKGDKATTKSPGVASDGEFWVWKVLQTIETLNNDSKHVSSILDRDENDAALQLMVVATARKLEKVSDDKKEVASGTKLLLLASLIQQYCSEELMSSDIIQACVDAATRMFALEKSKKAGRESAEQDHDGDAEPIDIIVDTIIGFMERSTVYMRTIGNQAFSLISKEVKESTFGLILAQLESRDPTAEDSVDSTDDEGEDNEGEDDEDCSSSENGDIDDSQDSNDEEGDEELRQKILEALSVNGIEAANEEDEDSEEDLMDDEQMMAIDEKLAEVFRSRVNDKKASKALDAQREATHFKNRVLDLVDIFIKRQPTSPFIVRLVIPLIDLVTRSSSDENQLSDKAQSILRSRLAKLRDVSPSVDGAEVVKILESIHNRARHERSSEHLATLDDCSIYLSQVLLQSGLQDAVLAAYRESLNDFVLRKNSSLNVSFFRQFIRRYRTNAWALRNELLELSSRAVNVYRRCQVYQLIHELIAQLPTDFNRQEISQFIKELRDSLFDVISQACDLTLSLTAPQMRDLFKLALMAARQSQRIDTGITQGLWDPAAWTKLADRLITSDRFKGAAQMCKQLAQVAGGVTKKEATASKRKSGPTEEVAPDGKKSKRKKVVHS